MHTVCGDGGGHRDGGVLGGQKAGVYGRGDTVGMAEGTELLGTVVCTQQVGKAEETQTVGSPVCTLSAGRQCVHFRRVVVCTQSVGSAG